MPVRPAYPPCHSHPPSPLAAETHGWRMRSLYADITESLIQRSTPNGLNRHRGYGATAARLTPDQKVGSSNLSGLTLRIHTRIGKEVCGAT